MKEFLHRLLFIIAAAIAIPLAILNRHDVTVSFIPMSLLGAPTHIDLPLFILIILCISLGILIGIALGKLQVWRKKKASHRP